MTNLVAPGDSGSIKLIVERELLRVGVTVFANPDDEDRVHTRLLEELDANPHKVIGIVAVQPGKQVWMEMYRIAGDDQAGGRLQPWRDQGSTKGEVPRIVHLRWIADHGDSPLVQALDMFLRVLQRNRAMLPLDMDAYVEAALRAVHRSADVLDVKTELPDTASSSIVRLILSPHDIRIGVAVWTDNEPELGDVLADMNSELHANPSDISALIGIVPGRESGLQPYELRQRGQPDGFLLRWNPKAGPDAIRWGLVQIFELVDSSGEGHEDPFAAVFHQGRADAFLEVGLPEDALLEVEDAILFNPHLAEAHALRAQALLTLGRSAAALNAVEQALALDPNAAGAYATQADTLRALGRPRDAVEAAERGLKLDHEFPALHGIRADALIELNRPEEALIAAEEAVRLDANDPRNHVSKAIALLSLERFEEAIKAADAALALDPDEPTVGQVKEDALRNLRRMERE
jgi:Flp pilus assembly protein TadD